MQVVVVNPQSFERKKTKLIEGGANSLQVIVDFDRTLTKAMVNGKRGSSVYGVIEESGILSSEYHTVVRALFDKYHPVEVDPTIPIEMKIPVMEAWWREANELLVSQKCNVHTFPTMVKTANLQFRDGVPTFFIELEKNAVPVLIFSAGIAELIQAIMMHHLERVFQNAHVISNHVITDPSGLVTGFAVPVIHTFNKNEMSVSHNKTTTWFSSLEARPNVILLGDSLGDVGMATGVPKLDTELKIGFLNSDVEKNLEHYKEVYDVLILNDGSFEWVVELLRSILH